MVRELQVDYRPADKTLLSHWIILQESGLYAGKKLLFELRCLLCTF